MILRPSSYVHYIKASFILIIRYKMGGWASVPFVLHLPV